MTTWRSNVITGFIEPKLHLMDHLGEAITYTVKSKRYAVPMERQRQSIIYVQLRLLKSTIYGFLLVSKLMKANPSGVVALLSWLKRGFSSPAPQFVKWLVLKNWGGKETWVETGTYKGETTAELAKYSKMVYSVEASPKFAIEASEKFAKETNIQILSGLSEDRLPELLKSLSEVEKADISFWLDGHFSGENTFQGPADTPIDQELATISNHISEFAVVTVLVDDVRCFNPLISEYSNYPEITFLTKWANSHNLFWTIEHDIFIATNRKQGIRNL